MIVRRAASKVGLLFSQFGERRPEHQDLGRYVVRVVDDDGCNVGRATLLKVNPLAGNIAVIGRVIHRVGPTVANRRTRHGCLKGSVEKNRRIPVDFEFWAMQEDTVEHENRIGGNAFFEQGNWGIRSIVEHRAQDSPGTTWSKRPQKTRDYGVILKGVAVVAFWGVPPQPIPLGSRPVKAIDGRADDSPPQISQSIGEHVRESRFARGINAVDSQPDGVSQSESCDPGR